MNWTLEVVVVPVTDIDRAKSFYADQLGFVVDHDTKISDAVRLVQLTPPGSAASIAIGVNLTHVPAQAGSAQGMRLVVTDIDAAVAELRGRGCDVTDVEDRPWGRFAWFMDPDGNGWELNEPAQPA